MTYETGMTRNEYLEANGHGWKPDAALRRLEDAHQFYRDAVNGIVAAAIKGGFMIDAGGIEAAMDALADSLDVETEISNLKDAGYEDESHYPDNHKKLCEEASERITDSMRIKRMSAADLLAPFVKPWGPLP